MTHIVSVREGDLIGEYRLGRLLGAGGMGAVFEAVHETIGKRVAIKVLTLDAKRHPEFERRNLDADGELKRGVLVLLEVALARIDDRSPSSLATTFPRSQAIPRNQKA